MPSSPSSGQNQLNTLVSNYNRQLENAANAADDDIWRIYITALNNIASSLRDLRDQGVLEMEGWTVFAESLRDEILVEPDFALRAKLASDANTADANADLWKDMVVFIAVLLAQPVPTPPGVLPPGDTTTGPAETGEVPPVIEADPIVLPEVETTPDTTDEPSTTPTAPVVVPPPEDTGFGMDDLLDPGFWGDLFSDTAGALWETTVNLPRLIMEAWTGLTDWSSAIFDKVSQVPGAIWSDSFGILRTWFTWLDQETERIVMSALGGAAEGVAAVFEPVLNLFSVEHFRNALDSLTGPIGAMISGAFNIFLDALEGAGSFLLSPVLDLLRPLWDSVDNDIKSIIDFGNPSSAWQTIFIGAAITAAAGAFIVGPLTTAWAQVQWEANTKFTPRLLGQDDLMELEYKFPQLAEFVQEEKGRLGISETRWGILTNARTELPFVPTIRDWYFRSGATQEELFETLRRYKFSQLDIEKMFVAYPELPNVQDVIRFGVREVYRPEIVAAFQLDAEFPEPMIADATRIGLHQDEVIKFWRAHWELPSTDQTFRMFHRTTTDPIPDFSEAIELSDGTTVHRVISQERLFELLRVADIMPRWRDPLTRIAFTPFTRVDIRRLYRTGVFDLAGVERAYLDIGYSQENALIQAEFVQGLEREQTFNELETILAGQATDGTIEVEDAISQLALVKVSDRAQEEARRRISARVDRSRSNDIVSAFRQAFRFKRIEEDDLRDELEDIGIPDATIDHIVNVELIRQGLDFLVFEAPEIRASGRGVPVRRFREGLTNRNEFRAEMASLGYTDDQVAQFEVSAILELDTNLRLATLTAIRAGLRTGRLDVAGFRTRASALGIERGLVDVYISQDQFRRRLEPLTDEELELRATGRGTSIRRFKEGWTDTEDFRSELQSLGYTDAETDQYETLAALEFDLDWKSDILRAVSEQFVRDDLTSPEYIERLTSIGMDPDRAATHLARLVASLRPRRQITEGLPTLPRYLTASGKVELRLAVEEFRSQAISSLELLIRLSGLELPEDLALATQDLEEFRLARSIQLPDVAEIPFWETDEGKIRVRTAREAFRNALIDADRLLRELLILDVPDNIADALTAFEVTRAA